MFAARNMMMARQSASSPITFAGLVTLDATENATSYTTPSYQPTANALVLAVVVVTSPASAPTYSGNGLTWVSVASELSNKITIFRAMGAAPAGGVGTVSISGGATSCSVRVVEFRNVKTSGSNGADAVVQSTTSTYTSATATATLAALTGSLNAVFATACNSTNPYSGTAETDWTEDYDGGNGSPVTGLYTMYRIATTDNTPTVTGPNQSGAMIALEISIP